MNRDSRRGAGSPRPSAERAIVSAVSRLRTIERARWTDQCARLTAWLADPPRDDAEAVVALETRRDLASLQAALAGKTPSAVVGRSDDPRHGDETTRMALACDEAAHMADNALVYARKLATSSTPDRERPRLVRWLGRLQLELADTGLPEPVPDFRAHATALVRDGDRGLAAIDDELVRTRDRLRRRAAPYRDHAALATALLAEVEVLGDKIAAACRLDDAAQVHAGVVEALRFVSLAAVADVPLTPSARVDTVWHELVLCTRAYAELGERFGRFVHHAPAEPSPEHAAQLRETLRRYHLVYGPPDPVWWGATADARGAVADCGACESP